MTWPSSTTSRRTSCGPSTTASLCIHRKVTECSVFRSLPSDFQWARSSSLVSRSCRLRSKSITLSRSARRSSRVTGVVVRWTFSAQKYPKRLKFGSFRRPESRIMTSASVICSSAQTLASAAQWTGCWWSATRPWKLRLLRTSWSTTRSCSRTESSVGMIICEVSRMMRLKLLISMKSSF